MKFILILAFSAVATLSLAEEGYVLNGTIRGNYSGYIYLSYGNVKDSALVQNNSFRFIGRVDKPVKAWLNLRPYANIVWVFLENSAITMEGDFSTTIQRGEQINLYRVTNISGSYSQKILDYYRSFCNENRDKEDFNTLHLQELKRMFTQNPASPVTGWILGDLATNRPTYTYTEFTDLYALLDTTAMHDYDLRMIKTGLRTMAKYGRGERFLAFELPNQYEQLVKSKTFIGKIVLFDFWASWCGPCRAKHPDLIKLQNKYEGKNFTVISISIDKDKIAWLNAIVKDGLSWENLLDTESKTINELGIQAIPFSYLVDETGNILEVNRTIKEIDVILQQKLK